jgi:hypothetical protein
MAVLADGERLGVLKRFAGELSAARTAFALSKPDLQAAVNAIDDWVEANQAAFNTAIPLPARTTLTAKQKVQLLFYVVSRRYEVEP